MTGMTSRAQKGGIIILLGLSMAVIVGFLGLVVDLGRLYVTRTEMQSAMDACALAAATELRPGLSPTDTQAINRAVSAALTVTSGSRNQVQFQGESSGIGANDIYFSDRLSNNTTTFPFGYVSSATADPATARYVMCAKQTGGIATWFMQVLHGFNGNTSTLSARVGAFATATTAPAQTNCGIPLGVCSKGSAPTYGLTRGSWISGRFDNGGGITGSFNWIDYTPPNGGANELRDLIAGAGTCNLTTGAPVGQTGSLGNAAAQGWNTRFGLYQGSYNVNNATPDFTGYAYTSTNWPSEQNAFTDFQSRRNVHDSYGGTIDTARAGNDITGLSVNNGYNVATHGSGGQLATKGADRRVATAPIVDCAGWASSQTVNVLDWACVLMLHPIGSPSDLVRMEYLGRANEIDTPCASYGLSGGTAGPLVPVLVH